MPNNQLPTQSHVDLEYNSCVIRKSHLILEIVPAPTAQTQVGLPAQH
jgi:hypothetical protein